MIRSIWKNIWNSYVLVACLLLAVPIVYSIGHQLAQQFGMGKANERGKLINYQNVPWAQKHFAEFKELDVEFSAFTGWHRLPFAGETITIDPERRNRVTPAISGHGGPVTYFFGGSTMWGTGSNDANTIPALFQNISGSEAVNFGETGWNAHQSLNQLIRIYVEGGRPEQVVFYDGVNDVALKCRAEEGFFSFSSERSVKAATEYKPYEPGYYFRVFVSIADAIRPLIGSGFDRDRPGGYDCVSDPHKAEEIAENLVTDWQIAKLLVESRGGRFEAFLQPVSYFSKTRLDHLKLDKDLADQFAAVYPIVRRKMNERKIGIDLTSALDRDEFIYVDFCHVSPNGNHIIAQEIYRHLVRQ